MGKRPLQPTGAGNAAEYPSRPFARVCAVSMAVLLVGLTVTFVVAEMFAGAVVCGVLLLPTALATVWLLRYRVRLLPNAIEEHTLFGTTRIAFTPALNTTQLVFKRYDLKITFPMQGGPRTEPVEFVRFFDGPDKSTPMEIRYDPETGAAVTSWQYDALTHAWIWTLILLGMAAAFVGGAIVTAVRKLRTVQLVERLAQSGRLARLPVTNLERQEVQGHVNLTVHYRGASGQLHRQLFPSGGTGPYLLSDGREVLALTSTDGRAAHAIRADGYPLVRPPSADELNALQPS